MKQVNFSITFCMLICYHAAAQHRPETGVWSAVNLPVNLTKHWQWHNDAGYRTLGVSVVPLQYLYRTGLRYHFNKQTSTAAGIALFFTKTDFDKMHHEFGNEFRIWEEISHQHFEKNNWQMMMRFRMEQRFFAATGARDQYTGYRFRLRYGIGKKLNENWSLQLSDEYMRQLSGATFSFDQNRVIISGIYHLNPSSQLQAGYQMLTWPESHQHTLLFTFTKTININGW